ncbi:CLIP domain-containing serine protease B10-like [Armigeres subalbatus]|uniref:CLIP domain-containing serine protease B10-like n=1 Tax=Armigeres subalbatus TaxID=124917 RepID=UPI002ED32638
MLNRLPSVYLVFSLCLWLEIKADTHGPNSDKLKLLSRFCGVSVLDRIFQGQYAQIFRNPWIALLQYEHDGEIEHGCSGSLINNRYVLTAASCLTNKTDVQLLNIRLGELDKSQYQDCVSYGSDIAEKDCAEPADDYGVESIAIHPEYNQQTFLNDIGLIRLNKNVTMHDNTSPICLPITAMQPPPTITRFTAIGWGTCGNRTGSNALLQSMLTSMDNVECGREISEHQICATRYTGIDVGGPLATPMPHLHAGLRFVQLGVASGAVDSCAQDGYPGVYTRVSSYIEWILETIEP